MTEPFRQAGELLWNGTIYTISLPERYLRGLTALLGGMLRETTELIVPDFVKDSTSYNIFIGNVLRFAIENIGEVDEVYDVDDLDGEYASRKILGNAIEGIGIATVHVSPLWIFAFFADSVKGGKAYLKRLRREMISKGYLDSEDDSDSLQELLGGLERTTRSLAQNIDTPPISRDEILDNLKEIQESIEDLLSKTGRIAEDITTDVSKIMRDFIDTATDEGQSLIELAGVLALQATSRAKKAAGLTIVVPQVTSQILYENIFEYYKDTLQNIHENGYADVASKAIEPYGNAIINHFSTDKETWTEKLFRESSRSLKRLFRMQNSK